jgi:acetyl esterase/lipase
MKTSRSRLFALWLCLLPVAIAAAQEPTIRRDLEFAKAGDVSLALDLYLPAGEVRAPLIAWVHGGAWRAGSKADMPLKALVAQGFAVASIDYRLSTVAPFPAQAHDLKAAIRFLRARAGEFGLDGKNIAIAGGSAGGHLAALVGTSNGVPELEGMEGAYLTTSSDVQAIVSFYGASNLQSILSQSTPHGLSVREPALRLLLGGLPDEKPDLARLASPVAHVRPGAPPLLLIHGDADPQMPFAQARELQQAYEKAKLPVTLEVIAGGRHGGAEFYDEQRLALVTLFLTDAIRHPQQPPPAHAGVR